MAAVYFAKRQVVTISAQINTEGAVYCSVDPHSDGIHMMHLQNLKAT